MRSWRDAAPRRSSYRRSKQRHTARQHPIEGRIYYPFHPRCGEAVLILKQYAHRGIDLVVIPQPDGSFASIPAWMTHESAAQHKVGVQPLLSLDVLRTLRAEVEALLGFLQSDSGMEGAKHEAEGRESTARPVRRGRLSDVADSRTEGAVSGFGGSSAARDRRGVGGRGGRQ